MYPNNLTRIKIDSNCKPKMWIQILCDLDVAITLCNAVIPWHNNWAESADRRTTSHKTDHPETISAVEGKMKAMIYYVRAYFIP